MRKLLILFLTLSSFITHSQFRGGNQQNRRQQEMTQTPREAPKFKYEVEKYLGIVIYDIEKAAKKSKIKLSSDVGKKFSNTLTAYNKEIAAIRRINSFTLRSTKEMVENFQANAQKTRDASGQKKIQETMMESLKPISEILKKKDLQLDSTISDLLTERQYKKWVKYNRKLYKVIPTQEEEEKEEK
ncbi:MULTISPECIES: hypothetical protein [unclassified Polaribacter]|uniref:hypothetical protein n=1 Tax=unclassified Polaribacter TaxID=196858 RepID=UPI0011BFA038|nr:MULTISPECIES: hypothetical protein [unclassified Polaribacter]TXD52766.1 hypothetical protein ES043_06950 [Polaribacter sp. IC063]TXD61643.1 hypothetical protein ES044_03910 [Polaribacter sp. IC066]